MNKKKITIFGIAAVVLLMLTFAKPLFVENVDIFFNNNEENIQLYSDLIEIDDSSLNKENHNSNCPCMKTISINSDTRMPENVILGHDDVPDELEWLLILSRDIHMRLFGDYQDLASPLYLLNRQINSSGLYSGLNYRNDSFMLYVYSVDYIQNVTDQYVENQNDGCHNDGPRNNDPSDLQLIFGTMYTNLGMANITAVTHSFYDENVSETVHGLMILQDWDVLFENTNIDIRDMGDYDDFEQKPDHHPGNHPIFSPVAPYFDNKGKIKPCYKFRCPGTNIWKNSCEIPDDKQDEADQIDALYRNCLATARIALAGCLASAGLVLKAAIKCVYVTCRTLGPPCWACIGVTAIMIGIVTSCLIAFALKIDSCAYIRHLELVILLCDDDNNF